MRTALRPSNLPTGNTLADFDFAFQPAIERSRIETLATCAFIRATETVLIQGPPGVVKTHLAVALGVKAVEHGFSAQFYRFDELKVALKADAHLPPSRLRRRKYLSTSLLVVDELGFEPMSRDEASLFFRLVTYRYGRGSILITTNKSGRDWTELLAGDEALTMAMLDRLLHRRMSSTSKAEVIDSGIWRTCSAMPGTESLERSLTACHSTTPHSMSVQLDARQDN